MAYMVAALVEALLFITIQPALFCLLDDATIDERSQLAGKQRTANAKAAEAPSTARSENVPSPIVFRKLSVRYVIYRVY